MKLFSFWRSLATYRVRIALNLKGITPDEVIEVNLMQGHQRDPKFRKVNPMMALPALVDGDGPALFESLAIIEYLDETHPNPPLLPKDPKARARVRGLAQIVACDTHPLIVPRVREYLAHEYKIDEAGVQKWAQHWHKAALTALEEHLSTEKDTGTYCQGEQITIADICLAGQVAGANFFKVDLAPFPTVARIADEPAPRTTPSRAPIRSSSPARPPQRSRNTMLNTAIVGLGWWGKTLVKAAQRLRRADPFRARRHARARHGARFRRRARRSRLAPRSTRCWPTSGPGGDPGDAAHQASRPGRSGGRGRQAYLLRKAVRAGARPMPWPCSRR